MTCDPAAASAGCHGHLVENHRILGRESPLGSKPCGLAFSPGAVTVPGLNAVSRAVATPTAGTMEVLTADVVEYERLGVLFG